MAELLTIQDSIDGRLDVKSLGEAANGDENTQVVTRTGETYPSAKKAIKQMFENGGLPAKPFATKALMTASALANGSYAQVTDGGTDNGLYLKTAGAWVKSGYSPAGQAFQTVVDTATIKNKYSLSAFTVAGFYIKASDGTATPTEGYASTDFIRVYPNKNYTYAIQTQTNPGGAFYDENKKYISGFGASSAATLKTVTSPANAAFMRVSTLTSFAGAYIEQDEYTYNLDKINNSINALPKSKLLSQAYYSDKFTVKGSYVNINTGLFYSDPGYDRTPLLMINPSTIYSILSVGQLNAACAWYDKDYAFISGFRAESLQAITSPVNAAFVALSAITSNVSNAKIVAQGEVFNTEELMRVVDSHASTDTADIEQDIVGIKQDIIDTKKTITAKEVVKSKAELQALNTYGVDDKAYPIGRTVYDQSLRRNVVADGAFWRLPDGTAASLAHRVYVFPDWTETQAALPTYAKSYQKIYNAKTDSATNWVAKNPATGKAVMEEYEGEQVLSLTDSGNGDIIYLQGSPIVLHTHIIYDLFIDSVKTAGAKICLLDASGNELYIRNVDINSNGQDPIAPNADERFKGEALVSAFAKVVPEASLANVAHIGFRVARRSGTVGKIRINKIDSVKFKPKLTLRFDDQRASVYETAMPIMQERSLVGLIAVITGVPELAADPSYTYLPGRSGMTVAQLKEAQTRGWDLISHTHTHPRAADVSADYLREEYRKSVAYLRDVLGSGDIASSCLVSPQNNRPIHAAMVQREFFDCQINKGHVNSHMPRQPNGTWESGSLWTSMGSYVGDSSSAAQLISYAQDTISKNVWGTVMLHDVTTVNTGANSVTTADFTAFCDWLAANKDKIDVVTISDVVRQIRPTD